MHRVRLYLSLVSLTVFFIESSFCGKEQLHLFFLYLKNDWFQAREPIHLFLVSLSLPKKMGFLLHDQKNTMIMSFVFVPLLLILNMHYYMLPALADSKRNVSKSCHENTMIDRSLVHFFFIFLLFTLIN